jgi:uncharacterized membrane protein
MNMSKFFSTIVADEERRALAKTVTWRIVATVVTGIVVYFFTGELAEASKATLTAAAILTVLYYFHEELWMRLAERTLRKGKEKPGGEAGR